jgi:MFS transporter, PAT family, beta-lactamase induction signal transducer AmpG
MSETTTATEAPKQAPRFIRAMRALGDRRMLAMLLMSFAAGIPYGAVLGALNAWLDASGIKPAQIGVLSFIILAYSFKFFWSPAFLQPRSPIPGGLGARRNWLILFQLLIGLLIFALSRQDPSESIWLVACAALAIALMSATHDIVLDAWRIEVARSDEDKDLMSAIYQFGYRFSGLLTGAVALLMADHLAFSGLADAAAAATGQAAEVIAQSAGTLRELKESLAGLEDSAALITGAENAAWKSVFALLSGVMVLSLIGTLLAPEPKHGPRRPLGELAAESGIRAQIRRPLTWALAAGWGVAVFLIVHFMYEVLNFVPETLPDGSLTSPPSSTGFTRTQGPIIVILFIVIPAITAAGLVSMRKGSAPPPTPISAPRAGVAARAADTLFASVLVPLMDLVRRFGWGLILIFSLVLTYRFADLVWGSFAYPFYLGENFGALGRDYSEIAFASKTFGVVMTIAGSAIGAVTLVFLGRMPCLVIGAFLAAVTNLLFADLAAGRFDATLGLEATTDTLAGADGLAGFLDATGLRAAFEAVIAAFAAIPFFNIEVNDGLTNLTAAIAAENLAVGFASVAGVAYLTSIVNPKYAAVQYALLASLTMLIGSLGRGWLGSLIESNGFYDVFILTFLIGLLPVVLAAAEWLRQWRMGHPSKTLKPAKSEKAGATS